VASAPAGAHSARGALAPTPVRHRARV